MDYRTTYFKTSSSFVTCGSSVSVTLPGTFSPLAVGVSGMEGFFERSFLLGGEGSLAELLLLSFLSVPSLGRSVHVLDLFFSFSFLVGGSSCDRKLLERSFFVDVSILFRLRKLLDLAFLGVGPGLGMSWSGDRGGRGGVGTVLMAAWVISALSCL